MIDFNQTWYDRPRLTFDCRIAWLLLAVTYLSALVNFYVFFECFDRYWWNL